MFVEDVHLSVLQFFLVKARKSYKEAKEPHFADLGSMENLITTLHFRTSGSCRLPVTQAKFSIR